MPGGCVLAAANMCSTCLENEPAPAVAGEAPRVQNAAAAGRRPEAVVPDGRANKRSFDDIDDGEEMADDSSSAPTPAPAVPQRRRTRSETRTAKQNWRLAAAGIKARLRNRNGRASAAVGKHTRANSRRHRPARLALNVGHPTAVAAVVWSGRRVHATVAIRRVHCPHILLQWLFVSRQAVRIAGVCQPPSSVHVWPVVLCSRAACAMPRQLVRCAAGRDTGRVARLRRVHTHPHQTAVPVRATLLCYALPVEHNRHTQA